MRIALIFCSFFFSLFITAYLLITVNLFIVANLFVSAIYLLYCINILKEEATVAMNAYEEKCKFDQNPMTNKKTAYLIYCSRTLPSPSERGFALKATTLLPLGANFSLLE